MRRCSTSRYVQYRSVSRLACRQTDRFYVSRICNARLLPDCWVLYQFDGSFANLRNEVLALRELLDVPKFVFVLAFDRGTVSRALAEYNTAWGPSGEAILEKIIDFPFELPTPTPGQVKALAVRQFGELSHSFRWIVSMRLPPYFPTTLGGLSCSPFKTRGASSRGQ
jgi:KAP family P-loop domain